MIALAGEKLDPPALLADFIAQSGGAGGVVSFTGIVRGVHRGEAIEELWLDHHERLTLTSIRAIGAAARDRFALTGIAIVHRVGAVLPGEPILFAAAAAEHRRAAFEALDYMIDRLKTDAMLWKREQRPDGTHWIEARPADHDDRSRWEADGDD